MLNLQTPELEKGYKWSWLLLHTTHWEELSCASSGRPRSAVHHQEGLGLTLPLLSLPIYEMASKPLNASEVLHSLPVMWRISPAPQPVSGDEWL